MEKIIVLCIGIAILYFTGWNIMYEGELKLVGNMLSDFDFGKLIYGGYAFQSDSYYLKDKSYFFSNELFLFNLNDLYYGVYNNHKYFNSPLLENMAFGLGLGVIYYGFKSNTDTEKTE